VITAARHHFDDVANGLFNDARVSLIAADGRQHLATSRERFDLVVADLFIPWEAGTGGLYTLEHFRTVRRRLGEHGAFVQWLPLYQMSRTEFMTIARTMLAAFPHVTVWRGDFFPERPILALVGTNVLEPLDPVTIAAHGTRIAGGPVPGEAVRAMVLPFYAGHLSRAPYLVPDGPLNTDDRPRIEYTAPITQRQQNVGASRWFVRVELIDFFDALRQAVPPSADPYLTRIDSHEQRWVTAGFHYHAAAVDRARGSTDTARSHVRTFEELMPVRFRQPERQEPVDRRADWEQGS